jgi:hypothetical protein
MLDNTLEQIGRLVSEVARLQRPHVARVCTKCESPCCARVHYLFTEKDILYLRLSGQRRDWRREGMKGKGCWFLGSGGCLLEPESRPFICHHYICPDLEAEMERHDPGLVSILREKFKAIEALRSRMWCEYLEMGGGEMFRGSGTGTNSGPS